MTMLFPRWLLKASTAGRASASWAANGAFATTPSANTALAVSMSTAATNSTLFSQLQHHPQPQQQQPPHVYQQQRFRWTKAKKKRFARFDRRQLLEKEGIPLTKPPYYFPIDTPVMGAVSEQDRLAESAQFDAAASEALASKQAAQKIVLRHHMSDSENAGIVIKSAAAAHSLKLQMSDRVRQLFDLHNGCQREVVQAQKKRGMELFQIRPGDTGSSAVQVIALTTRIQQLQTHFGKHAKDKHSKRGMDALYVRRRKLLDYMERKDFESYRKVVKTLGLVR
jgi:small subunit ribosomal protein S15